VVLFDPGVRAPYQVLLRSRWALVETRGWHGEAQTSRLPDGQSLAVDHIQGSAQGGPDHPEQVIA